MPHKAVTNYQPAPWKVPEVRRIHLHRSRSLKFRAVLDTAPCHVTNWTYRGCLSNAVVNRWKKTTLSFTYAASLREHSASLHCTKKNLAHANAVKWKYTINCTVVSGRRLLGLIRLRRIRCPLFVDTTRHTYKVLVGEPNSKNLLRKSKHRWDDNVNFSFSFFYFLFAVIQFNNQKTYS
jgi:hypothetical protein